MNTTDQPDAGAPVPAQKRWFLAGVFAVMAALIFAQLGHYALWDDESNTALAGEGILRTGDTSVLLNHGNIVAYRDGIDVVNFRDSAEPPLASYIAAASLGLFGADTLPARVPFALLGLGAVALLLLWVRRESWPFVIVFAAGLIGNVSFILFFRQCRYFAPAIFFSVAVAYVYWRWKPTPRNLLILSGLSFLLFASHYLDYIALYSCLGVDWLVWRRKDWQPGWLGWLCLFGPQAMLNGLTGYHWNPLTTHFGHYEAFNTLGDRLTLCFWYWRDMDRCEFFALPVILLALIVGLIQGRTTLVRGVIALVVYVVGVSLVSPQIVRQAIEGEVRYLTPIIPLAIAIEAGVLCALFSHRRTALALAAVILFGTNLLNGGPFLSWGCRSTILSYLGELSLPQTEPYTPTARWINDNVPVGASIWVQPYYMTYPLMFYAPKALYAWQLSSPPRPDLAGLPPIHFMGQEPPDFLVGFGPAAGQMMQAMQNWNRPGVSYQQVATINTYWRDSYRPELYWRNFEPNTSFDPNTEAVYIFKRKQTIAPTGTPEGKK